MRLPGLASACLVLGGLLAGCLAQTAVPAGAADSLSQAAQEVSVSATQDTGVIRGVVVDSGVRPLANVTIDVSAAGGPKQSTKSGPSGGFGLQGLAPGTYFVKATKAGYVPTQTSAEVVAGDSNPPITKLTMQANPSTQPYWRAIENKGYIECSVTAVLYGVAVCSLPGGALGDIFLFEDPVDRFPTHMQSEMLWSSTQALGNELTLLWSYGRCGGLLCDPGQASGVSPLLVMGNDTILHRLFQDQGNRSSFLVRVFNSDLAATRPPPGTTQGVCVPTLVLGTPCARRGLGLTVEQAFTVYTHVFYGYKPAGWDSTAPWRFSSGKPVPEPPK